MNTKQSIYSLTEGGWGGEELIKSMPSSPTLLSIVADGQNAHLQRNPCLPTVSAQPTAMCLNQVTLDATSQNFVPARFTRESFTWDNAPPSTFQIVKAKT